MKKPKDTSTPGRRVRRAVTWIDAHFQRRTCVRFIPSLQDDRRCCCGNARTAHPKNAEVGASDEVWKPSRHTSPTPTDAFGTLEFQGGPHAGKAQYVRLAYDTRPELIMQLFTREWTLELPKLLITVQGGKANFELQPKLKKVLRKGLLKAARTTGAWIFTGGTNTGVTRQVGDALLETSQRSGRVVSIGIAPWGIVENNHELVGTNRDVPYHSISSPRSRLAVLNNRHAYFLLVDDGSAGRYGAEIILRRKLEKYISHQRLHPGTHCSVPVVCLVIEGGTNTIRAVLEYVTDSPPVPVVVCDGSGRAADLLAFTHKYAAESGEQTVLENMKDYLISTIQRTFEVGLEQAECLYSELLQCTSKKNLITVFRITERPDWKTQELDQTILTALFTSQHLTPTEQLSLALTWNRVDIARSEIFVYGQEWPQGALDEAMMQALEHDRTDFVKLLLENGVSMRKFLTMARLEELYNTKQGPANTLTYILRDVRPHIPRGYVYTLHDIGLVINKLMGGAYRAHYTRRKFRVIYAKVMKKSPHVHRNSASFIRYYGNTNLTMSLLAETMPTTKDASLFEFPFNELLIWAVLTKRQQMALVMWQHGEEALAKALVACKLYKAMAQEAAEDDLETEIYEELRSYSKEFETIALELLDYCYRQDDDQARQLLTCELQNWSAQTCLSLAVAANHRALLAHACSQTILADLWMGGLRTRKNTNLKVVLGLLMPMYVTRLDFKTKEELLLMPQTHEEHQFELEENENAETGTGDGPRGSDPDAEALIGEGAASRKDTVVQENGSVLVESESYSQLFPLYDIKAHRPLRLRKKFYEFYTAPITKFWAHSMAYVFFLVMFTYVVLVKMGPVPSWQEFYVIAYVCTLACEKVREIVSSEPVAVSHKFAVWAWNMWNPCDAAAIIFFLIGLSLRIREGSMKVGRIIFCVDIIYWYLRILNILGVNKYLGPLVTMMGKMVKNMIYFVVLLLVVLMSFGVCRQAILFPDEDASWMLAREIFFQPYFMLYGEVFATDIDPPCGEGPDQVKCQMGRWITPVVMSMYLLVANILLINLLIAVFNNIFNEVNAVSHQVWMFQRFTVVMEYEQKPVLPPPLIALCHAALLFKYCRRKAQGQGTNTETYDNALKLFLDADDMERLYDFEEECVEGYFREQSSKLAQSSEERIKCTCERVENMYQKVEDINQKENTQTTAIQSVEFRIRKLEELASQTVSHLAVIHRFMATHSRDPLAATSAATDLELRVPPAMAAAARSTGVSGGAGGGGGGGAAVSAGVVGGRAEGRRGSSGQLDRGLLLAPPLARDRRRPTRSLTEVRPDPFLDLALGLDEPPPPTPASTASQGTQGGAVAVGGGDGEAGAADGAAEGADVEAQPSPQPSNSKSRFFAHLSKHESLVGTLGGSRLRVDVTGIEEEEEGAEDLDEDAEECARALAARALRGALDAEDADEDADDDEDEDTDTDDTLQQRAAWAAGVAAAAAAAAATGPAPRAPRRGSLGIRRQSSGGDSSVSSAVLGAAAGVVAAVAASRAAGGPLPGLVPPPPPPRRQLSKTRSEPDNSLQAGGSLDSGEFPRAAPVERSVTWAEPRITVIPPTRNPRAAMLLAMHSEYTSITDELETGEERHGWARTHAVCGLLSPPRSPRLLSPPRPGEHPLPARARHASEMSNPEMALYLEKEHLRSAEESDYLLMQGLIRQRITNDSSDDSDHLDHLDSALCLTVAHEDGARGARPLRRASAIDVRDLPTTQAPGSPAPHQSQASAQQQQTQPPADAATAAPSSAPPTEGPPPPPLPLGPIPATPPPHAQPMQLLSARSESKNSLIPTTETMC